MPKEKKASKENKDNKDRSTPKRKLTLKQQRRIEEYLATWNATEAAARTYDVNNRNTANNIWAENLAKPSIEAELADRIKNAKKMIYSIAMTWEKEETRVRACQDIIDRGEWKAIQKIVQQGINVNIDLENASDEELDRLLNSYQ